MRKLLIVVVLISSCLSIQAQSLRQRKTDGFLSFFRMKTGFPSLRWIRQTPRLSTAFSDHSQPSFTYWQGSSFTSYSENGRVVSINSFDVQGQLQETRTSILLRRKGVLSNWGVQISSGRNRPFFIYRIQ